MVRGLRDAGGIRDPRVLKALRSVPRHIFVRGQHVAAKAYEDYALPIGHDQTISQPWVVARMTELLDVQPDHRVLEIGTGSGYQTAILAQLAQFVFSMERISPLAKEAIQRMRELEIGNVKIQSFDGTVGWSEVAPFDRILVTAGAQAAVPPPLLDQLRAGGRLVVPEGDRKQQRLVVYDKTADDVRRKEGEAVVFVPLIGRHGWSANEVARTRR